MSEYWRLRPNQEQLERLQKAIKKYGTQGVITLPKEDKYEEFKKWFENQDEIIWHSVKCNIGFIGSEPFNEFEKELEEKQKEKEIKELFSHNIYGKSFFAITIGEQKKISKIYDELKEKGLLK